MRSTPITTPAAAMLAAVLFAGCAAPGVELHPAAGDFAFLEVQLYG